MNARSISRSVILLVAVTLLVGVTVTAQAIID